jgi:hypothetical protein
VADQRRIRPAWRVVGFGEQAPGGRPYAEERERAIGHHQRFEMLGLAASGNRYGRVVPQPDVLERLRLLAI